MLDGQQASASGLEVYKKAAADLLPATEEFCKDAWHNKAKFAFHVGGEVVSAITFGATLGAIVPKGPAGFIVAAAFTVPMVVDAVKGVKHAHDESIKPGADTDAIAHNLARKTVSGGFDFAVNMAAGYGGTEGGYRLSRSETAVGRAAQAVQRGVLNAENESIYIGSGLLARGAVSGLTTDAEVSAAGSLAPRALTGRVEPPPPPPRTVFTARAIEPEQGSMFARPVANLSRRAQQYAAVRTQAAAAPDAPIDIQIYRGTLHGHTKFDDGMGTAEENYAKAQAGNLDISFLTPHNHDGARQGVSPTDPRAGAEAGVPILAQAPEEYAGIINAAQAASKPGKFYAGFGIEAGTIGPSGEPGHGHGHSDGPDTPTTPTDPTTPSAPGAPGEQSFVAHTGEAPIVTTSGASEVDPKAPFDPLAAARLTHHGGVNHINIFGLTKSLIVTDRQPHPVANAFLKLIGRDVPTPDVVHYPDGDYQALAQILSKTTDVTGQTPIVQLNHPRFSTNAATDYGVTSFPSVQAWQEQFLKPFVKLQEVVKGEALNASPVVETMKPGDFDPASFAGYIDMGVHAGPTYGRDSHFGDPGGRPAGTGILAKTLDEPGVYEALRNRRTFATTNYADLQGVLTANNDAIMMGTVLDQAAVPELNLKLKVGGNIDAAAQYEIKLLADEQIGDGKVAIPVKTVNISGADLLKTNQQVAFDPITHKLGNSSAYYVEVSRTAGGSTTTDRMLTAPIWVEPLSGAQHGLATRMLVGNGAQLITSPWVPKF